MSLGELARQFLRPTPASAALCEQILRSLLAKDPRLKESPDGRWTVTPEAGTPAAEGYAVIESLGAPLGVRRSIEVEVAALRATAASEPGDSLTVVIRPEPYPPGLVAPPRLRERIRGAPTRDEAVEQVADFAAGRVLVCYARTAFVDAVQRRLLARGHAASVLVLRRLARAVLGIDAARSRERTASALGCTERDIATADDAARSSLDMLAAFAAQGVGDAEEILSAQDPPRREVDFGSYAFTREDLAALPTTPGVYVIRDANGKAVYVGKARNLRQRVGSYFRSRIEPDERVDAVVQRAHSLETRDAGSELEALLMEHHAIHDLAPEVNMQYAVHERGAGVRARGRRAVAVLPSVKPRCAELFLARGDEAFRQVRLSARWAKRVGDEVRSFFFGASQETEGDPADAQIFWSWYARRRDQVRMIDVDAASGPDDVVRLAEELFRDVLEGGDRVFRV